ncbi:threonine/serine exporter family protein [Hoyosella subflava]|uniref:Threonine export protein n=1 Tax=Hoyosella subflava (strain DSM 45089 / JCM 17490 / NBRC 109087 / DQS3-9A1) TaxID=443218 RepID=F6EEX7_HOYSD|nr:threonine/serine exporter family protein [Hoyosella subflava]AEF42114.1 Threonine export protein [Hoyosella subflava DQS3-9A1]
MSGWSQRLMTALFGPPSAQPATIDTAAIPAILPLRPIDLSDDSAVTETLDLAVRVGSVLLDAGTGAIDTQTQIQFVASTYGLEQCEVDVTYNSIVITAHRGASLPPATTMRVVHHRSLDFTRLSAVDQLIRRMRHRALTPAQAHRILDTIVSAPHPYPRWVATSGWAGLAASVAVLLGAGPVIALVAFLTTIAIYRTNLALNQLGLPLFYQQVVGGIIATIPAPIMYLLSGPLGITVHPSQIVATGIVVLLAGLSLVGSVQDAITGAPITASARLLEVVMMTAGIITGVTLTLQITQQLGIDLPMIGTTLVQGFTRMPVQILAGAVAAMCFALASYAERRALTAAALGGAAGMATFLTTVNAEAGTVAAAGTAAILVGFAGGLVARRALVPPLVVAVAGITPLLPGLAIYRGLYGLVADDRFEGISNLANAMAIGVALAAGVVLGEWMARTLRRPQMPFRPDVVSTRFLPRPWARPRRS